MTATRKNIHQWISTGAATATIAIAGLTFQASSIAAPDAEALSAEARASLERQLAIAREERDALVLKTEGQVTDLTEALEAERAKTAKVQDQLATAESAQTDAKAEIAELSETLDAARAEMAKVQDQLATAESAQTDAKAEIAELTRRSTPNAPRWPRCKISSPPPIGTGGRQGPDRRAERDARRRARGAGATARCAGGG